MLDAAMQARLRRVIPERNRKWEKRLAIAGTSAVIIAATGSFFLGSYQAQPADISDKILMEAVVLATCEGQTPASLYLEATASTGNDRGTIQSDRHAMLAFLIDRARNGTCGVLEDDGIQRKFARRAPSDG